MNITARHSAICPRCHQRIEVGDQVEWTRGRKATHISCEATDEPFKVTQSRASDLGPGVYEHAGEIYIVKPNREKTRMYAKRLVEINSTRLTEADTIVEIDFVYAPGVIHEIQPDEKMPLEKAKALTVRYGRCICGRHLKKAESVERGIGPVCIKSFATEDTSDPEPGLTVEGKIQALVAEFGFSRDEAFYMLIDMGEIEAS